MHKQLLPPEQRRDVHGKTKKRTPERERSILLCLSYLFWAVLLVLIVLNAKPQPGSRQYLLQGRSPTVRRSFSPFVPEPVGPVNVNTAGVEELCQIKYVGPSLAESIILERELNGPFYYREDLLNVKGIGEKTLQKMDGQFCLN
ncbi:MAG: helix-hairpin-helix domain-containing protein [Clostridiales bacterium]|nr:helix-hairpin-helix domain-containing protein [Clostridiales bacterium]